MKPRLYLAAKFERRLIIRDKADELWKAGYEILSTWIYESAKPPWMSHQEFFRKLAMKDLTEVSAADCIILDTAEDSERGGKEAEWGYGVGQWHKKLLIVVGPKRSVFHELCDYHFPDWETGMGFLREEQWNRE